MFVLLSALSAFHLSLTEGIEPGGIVQDVPNKLGAEQHLSQNQKIPDLANQLVLEYLYDTDSEILPNVAKRVDEEDSVSSMHRVFARKGIPPNLVKLSFGKRGAILPNVVKRVDEEDSVSSMHRVFARKGIPPNLVKLSFGKRGVSNDMSKRAYSSFPFGKREKDTQLHLADRRNGYSSFLFGKRDELDRNKRGGYSASLFGNIPKILAKRADSVVFFGRRGEESTKFMFGNREGDDTAVDDLTTDEN